MKQPKQIDVSEELLHRKIYYIRGKKVMFDRDLAELYGVETKALNQAVKRNLSRFPEDFMFQLTNKEVKEIQRSQFVTFDMAQNKDNSIPRSQFVALESSKHLKYLPYVFTEQGVAMLSSVLNSDRAISVNIQIMRMFTRLRETLFTNELLKEKVLELEKEQKENFEEVFRVLDMLLAKEVNIKDAIGFEVDN